MKKSIRNSNGGFSLVELIVVVLIMGILAVSLTPQVLKWVDNARKANDMDYMHSLESAIKYALMDSKVNAEVTNAIKITGSAVVLTVDSEGTDDQLGDETNHSELFKKVADLLGLEISEFEKYGTNATGGKIKIIFTGEQAIGKYTINDNSTDPVDW